MKNQIIIFLMIGILALSGCNTMRGLGQDIKRGGDVIEGAASK